MMWALIIPIEEMVDITPSNTVDLVRPIRAIMVGTVGDVKVNDMLGGAHIMPNLAAGVWHPCRATRVYATGTEPTEILGGI